MNTDAMYMLHTQLINGDILRGLLVCASLQNVHVSNDITHSSETSIYNMEIAQYYNNYIETLLRYLLLAWTDLECLSV